MRLGLWYLPDALMGVALPLAVACNGWGVLGTTLALAALVALRQYIRIKDYYGYNECYIV